ncbi:hypothetical protein [Brevibacterium samyangense]|uniref:Gram-positive cocci surface proteins LPxTG domain-containing protein n=1 Tax=Brevibacterium samyangense TaxID=366888 RepID=A0ABP5EID1_9MICO
MTSSSRVLRVLFLVLLLVLVPVTAAMAAEPVLRGTGIVHRDSSGQATWYGSYRTFAGSSVVGGPSHAAYCVDAGLDSPFAALFDEAPERLVEAPQAAWALHTWSRSSDPDEQAALSAFLRDHVAIPHRHAVEPLPLEDLGPRFAGAAARFTELSRDARSFAGPYSLRVDVDREDTSAEAPRPVTLSVTVVGREGLPVPDAAVDLTVRGGSAPDSTLHTGRTALAIPVEPDPGVTGLDVEVLVTDLASTEVEFHEADRRARDRTQNVVTAAPGTALHQNLFIDLEDRDTSTVVEGGAAEPIGGTEAGGEEREADAEDGAEVGGGAAGGDEPAAPRPTAARPSGTEATPVPAQTREPEASDEPVATAEPVEEPTTPEFSPTPGTSPAVTAPATSVPSVSRPVTTPTVTVPGTPAPSSPGTARPSPTRTAESSPPTPTAGATEDSSPEETTGTDAPTPSDEAPGPGTSTPVAETTPSPAHTVEPPGDGSTSETPEEAASSSAVSAVVTSSATDESVPPASSEANGATEATDATARTGDAPETGTLPRTGVGSRTLVAAALLLIGAGVAALVLSSRRR